MPIYEYQCQSCQHKLETLQKMSDAPLIDCPSCHQAELKKLISASAFQLTGTGWYASDFKSPPAAADSKTEAKPAAEKTSSDAAAAPEAKKPEPKAEVKQSESKSTETKATPKTDPTTK